MHWVRRGHFWQWRQLHHLIRRTAETLLVYNTNSPNWFKEANYASTISAICHRHIAEAPSVYNTHSPNWIKKLMKLCIGEWCHLASTDANCQLKLINASTGIRDLFRSCALNIDPMTFIYETCIFLELHRICKYKLSMSKLSKVSFDIHTCRQDRQTIKYKPFCGWSIKLHPAKVQTCVLPSLARVQEKQAHPW